MSKKKSSDALSRSDAVLIAALAIVLATASAAIGSAMTYHPSTNKSVAVAAPAPQVQVIPAKGDADSVSTRLLAEHRCLAEVLYYEARGEGRQGEQAVAEVVFHRMKTGNYGHSICAVVYEGAGHQGCQFSFTCNNDLTKPKAPAAWRQAEVLAAEILTGESPLRNATGGATNYHAISVNPEWAESMDQTTQIGNHIFYRSGPSRDRDS